MKNQKSLQQLLNSFYIKPRRPNDVVALIKDIEELANQFFSDTHEHKVIVGNDKVYLKLINKTNGKLVNILLYKNFMYLCETTTDVVPENLWYKLYPDTVANLLNTYKNGARFVKFNCGKFKAAKQTDKLGDVYLMQKKVTPTYQFSDTTIRADIAYAILLNQVKTEKYLSNSIIKSVSKLK